MKTYNDLAVLTDERERMDFILALINENQASDAYRIATEAWLYYRHMNPTIMRYVKIIHDAYGREVQDIYSPNHKIASNLYFYFVSHGVQYLLGNGVTFKDEKTKERLGKGFDHAIQALATGAKNAGVSFGFWNLDHLEVFNIGRNGNDPVFVPLFDEETGEIRAGIRYWQIDKTKPLNIELYEEDGYTRYIRRSGEEIERLQEKTSYVQEIARSEATGESVIGGKNYSRLPILPMYNINDQPELIGSQSAIDAYDLVTSQLVNNTDKEIVYWILKNCGGMEDDATLQRFIQRIRVVGAAAVDDDAQGGATAEPHTVQPPYEATKVSKEELRADLFEMFSEVDTVRMQGGDVKAVQIESAYEALNGKTDLFEYQVTDFITRLLEMLGIDDVPTYERSKVLNRSEEIQNVLAAAEYTSEEYTTRKLLTLMGDGDRVDEVMKQRLTEDAGRFTTETETEGTEQTEQVNE